MKKIGSAFLLTLVLAFASNAHAIVPGTFGPTAPPTTDPGPTPDTRGPIDPFPPPTWFLQRAQ